MSPSTTKRKQPRPGIRRKGNQWEAYVMVRGRLLSRRFPLDTPLEVLSRWRQSQRLKTDKTAPSGTLGRDAIRYLQTRRHQLDYNSKRHFLNRWCHALGRNRSRASITSVDIETVMSGWLTDGCAPEWKPLAPITVRHHRTALLLLYRTLDGSTAENPVASTFRPKDPPPEPRAPSLANVQRVLSTIRPSKTRARLMLILTTGLPHKQVMKLKREHWDREQRRLYVTRRSKGQGAPARVLPLSDAATKALIEFDRWDAWGDFSPSPIQRLIRETCKALGIPYFRPYDLRHLHGTLVYQQTGDLTTTARLLGHVDTKTAERYTQAAWMEVDTAAQAKVGAIMETIMETKENSPE